MLRLRRLAAKTAIVGALLGVIVGSAEVVAGVNAPVAQANCFGWNGPFVQFGGCNNWNNGPMFFPPPPPVWIPPPPPIWIPPPPPVWVPGPPCCGCGC